MHNGENSQKYLINNKEKDDVLKINYILYTCVTETIDIWFYYIIYYYLC